MNKMKLHSESSTNNQNCFQLTFVFEREYGIVQAETCMQVVARHRTTIRSLF